jgi:hypothetical protein
MVRQLLNGPGFFRAFPEFAALQTLVNTKPVEVTPCRGCGGSRAHEERIVGSFINILQSLPENRVQHLKSRAGATNFSFNGFSRRSQTTETMIL